MLRVRIHLYPVFIFSLLHATVLPAQQNTQQKPVPLLPDIDPQDIEIKGNYRPQFLGIRRQPVLGFNPVPPIFSQNGPRIPFIETPEQSGLTTAVSFLERPPQPPVVLRDAPVRSTGFLEAGVGSFLTPELRAVFDSGGEIQSYTADAIWISGNGHLDTRTSSFRMAQANASWIYRPFVDTDWRAGIRFSNSRMHLLTAEAVETLPVTIVTEARDYLGAGVHGEYRFLRGLYRRLQVKAQFEFESTGFSDNLPELKAYTGGLFFSGRKAAAETEQWISYGGEARFLSPSNSDRYDGWVTANPYVSYAMRKESGWSLQGGLKGLFGNDNQATKVFLLPEAEFRYLEPEQFEFKARLHGDAANYTAQEILSRNTYVNSVQAPGNEYSYNMMVSGSYRPSRLFSIHVSGLYQHFWRYQYVARTAGKNLNEPGIYEYHFQLAAGIRRFRPAAGVTLFLSTFGLTWYNEIYGQSFQGETAIPFQEDLGLISDLSWQFDKIWAGHVSLRYVSDRSRQDFNDSLPGFLLLDARLGRIFSKKYSVFLAGRNLTGSRYAWITGYTERPAQIVAGASIKF